MIPCSAKRPGIRTGDAAELRVNRLEQTEKLAHTLAALARGLGASDRPASDDHPIRTILGEQIDQREHIFAFGVVERMYERSLSRADGMGNRIALLIAAQVAIEVVLVDKSSALARGPDLVMFVAIAATALLLRAFGEPDFLDDDTFAEAAGARPAQKRDALAGRLRTAIARNRRLHCARRRVFSGALLATIVVLGWALW
jgi:hypothetical protein